MVAQGETGWSRSISNWELVDWELVNWELVDWELVNWELVNWELVESVTRLPAPSPLGWGERRGFVGGGEAAARKPHFLPSPWAP
jgi:hypothetical protein